MTTPLAQMQQRAGYGYSRGSATDAAAGLVGSNGQPLPPTQNYLQIQDEAARQHDLDSAWRAYTGKQHGHFRPEPGQPDVNVITNRAATIVDTGVDFLYGKNVTLEVLRNGKPDEAAQAALDGCWGKDAKRMTTLSKLAQNGGIFGHVFAKIVPPYPQKGMPYCRVVPLDPSQVSVITHPEDVDCVLAYIIEWRLPGSTTSGNDNDSTLTRQLGTSKIRVFRRVAPADDDGDADDVYDPDATWSVETWLRGPNNTMELLSQEEWPHPWPPIVDWQSLPLANLHWGMRDIPQNVLHLNSVLNLILSNVNANAKYHGFPVLSASGMNPDQKLDVGPGRVLKFPSPDAKLQALQAYGDTPGLLSFADNIRSDMDEQSRVPAVATGRMRDAPKVTSGVAFQMMYGPLLSKNTHKQRLYETGHEELSLRMLSLCGYGDGTGCDGWEVVTHWPSPLPDDDQSTAQLVTAAKQAGMSDHFVCKLLEEDYETEMEHRADEQKEAMRAAMQGQGAMPGMPPMVAKQIGGAGASGQSASASANQPADQPSAPAPQKAPPVNSPAAVRQRQVMQAANGKKPTANGM